MKAALPQRLAAEALGTALLVATVVGSGVMGETLTKDTALVLLANTLPTGAILVVLITILGPISGANFNPAVSLVFALKRDLAVGEAALYAATQIVAGILGTIIAHLMFALPMIETSLKMRTGAAQWFADTLNGGVSNNFGAGNFGAITTAYDPRIIQLALKLYF